MSANCNKRRDLNSRGRALSFAVNESCCGGRLLTAAPDLRTRRVSSFCFLPSSAFPLQERRLQQELQVPPGRQLLFSCGIASVSALLAQQLIRARQPLQVFRL